MSSAIELPPTFYRPAEVARMLRCSEWWVKEQARRRRIPFIRAGGRYLFTAEHIAEIVQRLEVRPIDESTVAAVATRLVSPAVYATDEGTPRLTARVPPRARAAARDAAA